jgi:HlyD family secretion protein
MKKKIVLAVVAVAVVAAVLGLTVFRKKGGAVKYRMEALGRGDIESVVVTSGTVNPVRTVDVGSQVSGKIDKIYVDFNSSIKEGQVLAELDQSILKTRIDQNNASYLSAVASYERAKVTLANLEKKNERAKALFAKDLISFEENEAAEASNLEAKADVQSAQARVAQSKSTLDSSRVDLGYATIKSPIDGVVISRKVEVGQTVAAGYVTPTLFQIAQDLTKMQVNTNVSESDIGTVREGQLASFSVDAYPGRVFAGTAVQVRNAPLTVQNVVTYDVVIGVDNSSLELKPGMTATVTITTARRQDALRLPIRALRFNPQGKSTTTPGVPEPSPRASSAAPAVWVLQDDGTLRRIEVQTGLRDDQYAEVLSGDLHAGDQVAVALRRTTAGREAARPPGFLPRFR